MIKQDWKKLFERNFFEKCCKLICNAKPVNKPKYLFDKKYNKPEDFITYDYVEAIKKVDIGECVRVECGSKQKCGKNFILQEPDITFSTLDNYRKTCFECKVLGRNYEYIKNGIERFINNKKYAFPKMPFYGMLGYVRDDLATKKQEKLQKSIKNKKDELNLTNQKTLENSDSQAIFKTRHKTINKKCNANIEITHILHSWS